MNGSQRLVSGVALLACIAAPTLVGAQEAAKPGPEHQKLGYFVGTWTSTGEIHENPMGLPAGKFKGKDKCEWFEGNFAVVCKSQGEGPMGKTTSMGIMGYSPDAGVYTYFGTDSTGMAMVTVPRGHVDGKTWVYDDESEMGGETVKNRYTMVETSATSYTFKWEVHGPDGWKTIMSGVSNKS